MSASAKLTTIKICDNLILNSPLIAASGALGFSLQIGDITDLSSLGAFTTPTLTMEPRAGYPPPRSSETPSGLLISSGLPNPGLKDFIKFNLPELNTLSCPLIVNITANNSNEWKTVASGLAAEMGVNALELNFDWEAMHPPEDGTMQFPTSQQHLDEIHSTVAAVRNVCSLPLIAKLPSTGIESGEAAKVAVEAGVNAIAVSYTFPGIVVKAHTRSFKFSNVVGQLSGPCIKPLALYQVWRARNSVKVPVIASGGVMNAEDVLEFLIAGASAVAVGTAMLIHPNAISTISDEMIKLLEHMDVSDIREMIGVTN